MLNCVSCEGRCPDLLPDNDPAWDLWVAVQTQWRVDMGGVIGLDYQAVWLVAESIGVEMHHANFMRIKALEKEALKHARNSK